MRKTQLTVFFYIYFNEAEKQVTSTQVKEHRGAVLDLIEMYLKGELLSLNRV